MACCAYEVKLQGYEGDDRYWKKIERAREIMEAYCYPLSTVVVPADERHPVIVNAQLLKPAIARAHQYLTPDIINQVEHYCESGQCCSEHCAPTSRFKRDLIPPLLATGVLQADVAHHHISAALELSAAYGDLGHLCLIEELQS
jgi:hypothetical protein